jgi:hypothetical protein
MEKWSYSAIFLDLVTKWTGVVTFTPGERAPAIYWIGSWVGPTAVLVAVEKRYFASVRNRTLAVQPVARRYTGLCVRTNLLLYYAV